MNAYNPWAVVTTIRRELAREGVKTSFTTADRMGDADELRAASELLQSMGVEPVVPDLTDIDCGQ